MELLVGVVLLLAVWCGVAHYRLKRVEHEVRALWAHMGVEEEVE